MTNSALENLPEISILDEEGITLEALQDEMIADYEQRYQELTGKEITLYPADEKRLELLVVAGMLYQLGVIMDERYRMNFLQYMHGDVLRNWAANFGFTKSGESYATVSLRFYGSDVQQSAVGIPQGTRVTAGDDVFFTTDTYAEIKAGDNYVDVTATCTETGAGGNGYRAGQLTVIVDPVNFVERVENLTISDGGRDAYTDDELKELILSFPSTYSVAGPEDAYLQMVQGYSERIVSVRRIMAEDAVVCICIMCANGELPDAGYCEQVRQYIMSLKSTPDTDKVEIVPPEAVMYELDATYYIAESQKDIAESIRSGVEDAVTAFVAYTQEHIGHDINTDMLTAYANAAGARRIVILSPAYQEISENQIALCKAVNLKYGGLEDE